MPSVTITHVTRQTKIGGGGERERYENNDISYFGVIKNKIKIIIQKYKVSFD